MDAAAVSGLARAAGAPEQRGAGPGAASRGSSEPVTLPGPGGAGAALLPPGSGSGALGSSRVPAVALCVSAAERKGYRGMGGYGELFSR